MSNELLPCPFCGGEADQVLTDYEQVQVEEVRCRDCWATVGGATEAAAILAWNHRAPIPATPGDLLDFQTAVLREATAHRHRMDEQLYPLREVARLADLVWRGAVRCQTDEETYFRISPMDMEWLATALTKVAFCLPNRPESAPTPSADKVREAVLFTLQEEGYSEIQTNYMVPSIMAALASKESDRG